MKQLLLVNWNCDAVSSFCDAVTDSSGSFVFLGCEQNTKIVKISFVWTIVLFPGTDTVSSRVSRVVITKLLSSLLL